MGLFLSSGFLGVFFESIASITTGRIDGRQSVEVEVCDGLQRFSCWRGAKAVGKGVEPCNIFGVEGDQFADGIAPALRTAAPIDRPTVSDHGRQHPIVLARPMASLALGIAEGMVPFRLATSWHGFGLRYVTGLYGSTLGLEGGAALGELTIGGEPALGAQHRAATLYSVGPAPGPDHEAAMRFGGKAPGRRAHSSGGIEAMVHVVSPPPRIVIGGLSRRRGRLPKSCVLF